MTSLHITNGDHAIERLKAAGIAGDMLAWKDVLHEGPVPGRLGFAQLRETRARFIADRGWAGADVVRRELEERDALLDECGNRTEVVLWFEHDLYDQLQLLQILHRFGTQGPDPRRLTLVCEAEYLGMMKSERVRALYDLRREVNLEQVRLAMSAWTAFTAPRAAAILELLEQDTSSLPFLAPALRRHLEEFPSNRNGLSRSEQQALEVIDGGVDAIKSAFPAAHHQREDAIFLGDWVFAWYIERLSNTAVPLIQYPGKGPITAPREDDERHRFWDSPVAITDAGRAVLAGSENHVALNGIDRWLGGVHLSAPAGRPWVPPF